MVTEDGEVVGATWHALLIGTGGGLRGGEGDFDIVIVGKGPEVVGLEAEKKVAGAGGKEGEGEVEEKTFLQK